MTSGRVRGWSAEHDDRRADGRVQVVDRGNPDPQRAGEPAAGPVAHPDARRASRSRPRLRRPTCRGRRRSARSRPSATASRTCWRSGRPSSGARSLGDSRTASRRRRRGRPRRRSSGCARRRAASRSRGQLAHRPAGAAVPLATTSAMIASAVSAGARPPRSRPIGPAQPVQLVVASPPPRAAAPGGRPGSSASRPRRRTGSPGAAPRRSPARRTSRRGSAPRRHRPGPSPISSATSSGQPTMQPVDVRREPRRRRERRATVDDDRLVAQLPGEPDERASHLDRARRRRAAAGPGRPRRTAAGRRSRPSATCRGRARRGRPRPARRPAPASPSEPSSAPSSWTTSGGSGGAPLARLVAAERRRAARPAAAASRPRRRRHRRRARARRRLGRHGRLDEHVDRAAAGQPDVPRLLVADPVADDPRVAVWPARRSISSAAAPSTQPPLTEPAIRPSSASEQDRALRPRRRAERPDHDGAPGLAPSAAQPSSVSSSSFMRPIVA